MGEATARSKSVSPESHGEQRHQDAEQGSVRSPGIGLAARGDHAFHSHAVALPGQQGIEEQQGRAEDQDPPDRTELGQERALFAHGARRSRA
jgi:hypothetical protein